MPTGELLDGQRGLVPSNFVDFVQDSESHLADSLAGEVDQIISNHAGLGLDGERILDLRSPTLLDPGLPDHREAPDASPADLGEDTVPYPRKITLIKQLAKSVIVGWEPPAVPPGWGTVSGYTVLVDQEPRLSLALGSRTKALVEKLSVAACTHRVSVQCVTSRGRSDQLQCTLLVGKDVVVAPSHLRVDGITQVSAQLSWAPTNSNYSHTVFLNEEELGLVPAAQYKYQLLNLQPNTAYTVKVLARPHQVPWQLPLEQREKKETSVEFCTLPAGGLGSRLPWGGWGVGLEWPVARIHTESFTSSDKKDREEILPCVTPLDTQLPSVVHVWVLPVWGPAEWPLSCLGVTPDLALFPARASGPSPRCQRPGRPHPH